MDRLRCCAAAAVSRGSLVRRCVAAVAAPPRQQLCRWNGAAVIGTRTLVTRSRGLRHTGAGCAAVDPIGLPLGSPFILRRRRLFIKVETTPNPDSLKFVPESKTVLPEHFGAGVHFSTVAEAVGCKMARRLLKFKEITSVFLGRDFVSVNKIEDASWAPLRTIILDALMDAFSEAESKGGYILDEVKPSSDTVVTAEDSEVVAMIKELIDTRIRPAVQEDGGDIFFHGFNADTGVVKLRMAGSCVGCPSSTATLRDGVQNMLMHYVPEVTGIEQILAEEETVGHQEFTALEAKLEPKQ